MTPAFALKRKPEAAFEALYRRHVHEIYRYALAVLGNDADAEDVTQTTFMNAYRAVQSGERPRKPAHWLRAIAHNVCRQRFRHDARRPREVVALDEIAGPPVHEEPEGPSATDIKRALQSLPFNQRSALVMRELEGRRQTEIAAALGLSESAVEALLFRARRGMREQLESSITCGEAERAVSRQLDRSLPRAERARLRAHLRECSECATFARQARAQRGALKSLGAVPLPASLLSWGGGGATSTAIGLKVAAGVAAVVVAAGAGDLGVHYLSAGKPHGERHADQAAPSEVVPGSPVASAPVVRRELTVQRQGRGTAAVPRRRRHHGAAPKHTRGTASPRSSSHRSSARAHALPAPQTQGPAVRAHGTPAASDGRQVRAHGAPAAQNSHAHPARPAHPAHPAHPPQPQAPPPDRAHKPPKK
jgi:RNA polymerase sigma factor (sigma-70 family)